MHSGNRRRSKKGTGAIFEEIMTGNFPKFNVKHKTTDPESSENTKPYKCPSQNKNKQKQSTKAPNRKTLQSTSRHIIVKLQKMEDKEKVLKKPEEKNFLPIIKQR